MNIEQFLTDKVAAAVSTLYGNAGAPLQIQKTRKEFEGDYTLVVFPLLKASRKSPEATATEIGEYLVANTPEIKAFNVIKGFLNLSLDSAFWAARFREVAANDTFGQAAPTGRTVMIEYSSPSTNKPLHLGHIRNNLLGYSVAQILKANGHNVIKANLVNDRGIHICKSMLAWQKWGDGITPEAAHKKGDHLIGDFYVLFDKHYREEVAQLQAEYEAGGMGADDTAADHQRLDRLRRGILGVESRDVQFSRARSGRGSPDRAATPPGRRDPPAPRRRARPAPGPASSPARAARNPSG